MKNIKIGNRLLYYTDEGSGFPVMLLHGARYPETAWNLLIPELLKNNFRVIHPHRGGRGKSQPHAGDLSLSKDRKDMLFLIDKLGIKKIALIGHSQGAFVMQQMYLARKEIFSALICVDSCSFGRFMDYSLNLDRLDEKTLKLYKKHKAKLFEMKREFDYPSDFNVKFYLDAWEKRVANPEQWEAEQQKPDIEDIPIPEGKYCKVPLLVFAAGRGRYRDNDLESIELKKSLPAENAKLFVVTNSGHSIQREQTDMFNATTINFLKQISNK